MIRILIADDHAIVRSGLKQIVAETTDIQVIDEAASGKETMDKIIQHDLDVVILDISMPDKHGLDILKDIKLQNPHIPVLILSMHPEEQYAIRSIKSGAAGYLTKESIPEELLHAIRKVAAGKKYISASLSERIAASLGQDTTQPPHTLLSNREYEVMTMLATGKSVSTIAAELSLSVKTISTYRSRILEKMEMTSNAELMRYAIEYNLVD
ncbi:MAG: response regulator [bacterium]